MKVEVKKLDKLKRSIKVEISGEAFLKEKKETFTEIGKKLKVSGFRPGTAPLDVLEKFHGGTLKEEFLKKAIPLYYQKAIEESKLFPIILPRIYDVELLKDKLVFSAEFEVKPQITLKDTDYIGIKIKDIETAVKDEEIKKVVNNLKDGVKKVVEGNLDDDEIANWAGYDNFDVLKEAIKTEIKIEKLRDRRIKVTNQVTDHLLKNIKIEVSKTEIERHHKELVNRELYNLKTRGIAQADIEKYTKDIEEKLKTVAENEIKIIYILEAIASKEKIKISNNLGEAVLGFILSKAKYI
ncbi:MAG: hypothetical protein JSV34_02825 [Candidatus Omnitrophota bacterium]|nr:MAG: hypothetical protein JSV34_02825 [Candidatus Omnitrophota bacterium]